METSFHRGNTGAESLGDFGVAATLLDKCQQRAILGAQLRQSMTERVEFLRIHRTGRLGDVLVLFSKRQEYPPQFLPAQLIDARVAGEAEEPRLKLRRRLQPVDGAHHLDEHLLRQILDVSIEARLCEQTIQSPVEHVTRKPRQLRRRDPHRRLLIAPSTQRRSSPSVSHVHYNATETDDCR